MAENDVVDVTEVEEQPIDINESRMFVPDPEEESRAVQVARKAYPNGRIYSVFFPYQGTFIIRAQLLNDVREASLAADRAVDEHIRSLGGYVELEKLDEVTRARRLREIDDISSDATNKVVLSSCVLYPTDVASKLEEGKLEAGTYQGLIGHILDISGFVNTQVREI
jgi:hypothetical protein